MLSRVDVPCDPGETIPPAIGGFIPLTVTGLLLALFGDQWWLGEADGPLGIEMIKHELVYSFFKLRQSEKRDVAHSLGYNPPMHTFLDQKAFLMSVFEAGRGAELRAVINARSTSPDSATKSISEHGWVFYGPDGEWHWSAQWDPHESIEDQRPATMLEKLWYSERQR